MKKFISMLLVVVSALSLLTACSGGSSTEFELTSDYYEGVNFDNCLDYVVKDGVTNYKIVYPNDTNETILYAVDEMEYFIRQSTGITITSVSDENITGLDANDKYISIGETKLLQSSGITVDYSSLKNDGFIIQTKDKSVFINGASRSATLYGVYDFLEKFIGVRFVAMDETYVPKVDEIPLFELDIKEIPAFEMRTYLFGQTFENIMDMPFYARTRTNCYYGNPLTEKYGGGSPIYYGRVNLSHNAHYYVPMETYYETHPEFYYYSERYDNYTIDLLNGLTPEGKLDETKEVSVAKIVIEEMKKDLIARPSVKYIAFELEDGSFMYEYAAGSPEQALVDKYGRSGILVRFCNVVATELQKWADEELDGREIYLRTDAYSYTAEPPVKIVNGETLPIDDTVICADNVVIEMAFMQDEYYSYYGEHAEEYITNRIAGWNVVADNFAFWNYDCAFGDFLWYFPTTHKMADDVQGTYELGNVSLLLVSGPFNSMTDWQGCMKHYIYTHLLWDPYQDVETLLNEYLELYYYDAAPYIKQMLNYMDDHYAMNYENGKIMSLMPTNDTTYEKAIFYSANFLETAIEFTVQAEEAIRNSDLPEEKKDVLIDRVLRVRCTPVYMKMIMYEMLYLDDSVEQKNEFTNYFFDLAASCGVDMVSESEGLERYKNRLNGV